MANYVLDYSGAQVNEKLGLNSKVASKNGTAESLVTTGEKYVWNNLVESKVPVYGLGKNLLDNWYFVGGGSQQGGGQFPINQRGQSVYTGAVYGIDRWKMYQWNSTTNVTLSSSCLTITGTASGANACFIFQEIKNPEAFAGKTVTLSVLTGAVSGLSPKIFIDIGSSQPSEAIGSNNLYTLTRTLSASLSSFRVCVGQHGSLGGSGNTSVEIYAIKFELGDTQTLCHNEGTDANPVWVLNEIPNYEEELIKCQTSIADGTDTYANKTMAARQDLASIQATGTTNATGATITAGTYFYLNGTLVQAKVDIASGATFTSGTNYNVVTAGALNELVDSRVPVYGFGKNLLTNWYFVGGGSQQGGGQFPINSRGLTTYSGQAYGIDCWKGATNGGTESIVNDANNGYGIKITGGSSAGSYQDFVQFLPKERSDAILGKTATLSVLLSDGRLIQCFGVIGTESVTAAITTSGTQNGLIWFQYYTTSNINKVRIVLRANSQRNVVYSAVKFELGTEQTLCHQEGSTWVLNEYPSYEEELIKCQIYNGDSNDTYVNKSLATEQQLAVVETGSTASRSYTVGQYFCWNGLLYRAKTAISSGASFTDGTNCTAVTVGAELVNLKKYSSDDMGRVRGASVDVDISAYQATGAFAFLIVTRGWTTATSASSMYLVHGIQTSSHVGVVQIFKDQYGAEVTKKDATTITLTWGNSDGGYYAILPIIRKSI